MTFVFILSKCLLTQSGFPYPENIALATLLESVVRGNGGVPATIGILGGIAKVGMSGEEIIELASTAENKSALKVSRRDLGYICGMVASPHQAWHEDVTANHMPGHDWEKDPRWYDHFWNYDSV